MYFAIYAETDGVVSLIDEAGEYNPAYAVRDPSTKQEANKAGSLEFSIHPSHPYFNSFIKMRSKLWAIQDGICIFYGRFLYAHKEMNGTKKVYCEGALSYLLDTLVDKERALKVQRILGQAGVISVRDYTKFDLSVADFFKLLIALHNSQVEQAKQFTIGEITFASRSEKFNFDIDGLTNSADFILDNLVEKVGGYIRVRPTFNGTALDKLYIDWKALPEDVENLQTIEFGKNMISFNSDESGAELFTIFVPTGKPTDSSLKDVHLYDIENWDDPAVLAEHPKDFYFNHRTATGRSSIYTEPTGDPDEVQVHIEADATTLANEIQITTGINTYGKIYKAYDLENVNAGDTLYDRSIEKIIKMYDPDPEQISVTALDLYKLGYGDQPPIRFGAYLTVKSGPHGLNRRMLCCQIDHKLRSPQSTSYTLTSDLNEKGEGVPIFSKETSGSKGGGGGSGGSLTGGTASAKTEETVKEVKKKYETIEGKVYVARDTLNVLAKTIGFSTYEEIDPTTGLPVAKGSSSELNLLKDAMVMQVDDQGRSRSVVDMMKDYMGFTIVENEQGIPEMRDDEGNPNPDYLASVRAQISLNKDLISLVVNPQDGQTPASIKIGAIVDKLNTTSGVAVNAEKILLSGGSSITLDSQLAMSNGLLWVKNALIIGAIGGNGVQISSGNVLADDITIRGGLSASYTLNNATLATMVKTVGVESGVLTLTRFDGTSETFSRAITSWETAWDNGVVKITAQPQNQYTTYDPPLRLNGSGVDNFSAEIYATEGSTAVAKKSVYGYLWETVNGALSNVAVRTAANGGGTSVAQISTQATYAAGKQDGIDETTDQIGAKPTTITANGTYNASSDDLLGYSSVTVNVQGTNYDESDVVNVVSAISNVSLGGDNHWYGDITVTKKLPSTSPGTPETFSVNVQEAINTGVQSGWSAAYGITAWPAQGTGQSFNVTAPGSNTVGDSDTKTFSLSQSGSTVYCNDGTNNVAELSVSGTTHSATAAVQSGSFNSRADMEAAYPNHSWSSLGAVASGKYRAVKVTCGTSTRWYFYVGS